MKKSSAKETFWFVFDILFVLILCFAILFTTLLITPYIKTGADATGYHIVWWMLIGSFVATFLYLLYVVKNSTSELKKMTIEMLESDKNEEGE